MLPVDTGEMVAEITHRREAKQPGLLKGALWFAAARLVEGLFEELRHCEDAASIGVPWDWQPKPVCGGPPPRYAAHYTPRFVRQLILVDDVADHYTPDRWATPFAGSTNHAPYMTDV